MWKTFLFLACVSGSIPVISCDDATTETTGETIPAEEITATRETEPTDDTDSSSTNESRGCGCGGHPPICKKNEVYYNCSGGCVPRRCSEIGFPLNCDKKCTPGCVCKDNYVRTDNGTCIPILDCPSCGGDKNAQQGCSNYCGHTCSTYNKPPRPCPLFCINNGCACRKGFVYDNNVKTCVKPEDCTPICQANEEYSPCTNGGCDARNCSQIGKQVPCIKLDPKYCIKGCVCVKGYLRASNGTCVPKDQCTPKCDKPNEVYDVCPAPCPPKQCNVNEALIRCRAPPKPGDPDCKPGCRCADNYYRNATGTCVLKKNCEKPLTCDRPNEVYDACPAICPAKECGVNPAVLLCMRPPEYGDPDCKPSCVCIDGYVRNDARECIPRDKCPKPCGKNEHWEECYYSCGGNETCDDIGKKYNCPAKEGCLSGCRCNKGYWRNADNVCIPENQCPSQQCQGQNEFFDTCISGCSNQTCETIGKIFHCPLEPAVCRTGCRCKPGFYRNASNVCVSESQCPTPSCPEGEIYSRCPTVKCEGDYCPKNRDSPQTCPVGIVCDPPRCVCGLLDRRDRKTGKCIKAYDCPPFKCDGPNEGYDSCPSTCPGEKCTDYINDTKCPPYKIGIVVPCKPQCRCKKGYYRNSDGICILASQCVKCGPNEVFSNCTNGGCEARNCSQAGKPVPCVKLDPKSCIKGCVCQPGYLRSANGTCVPKNQCNEGCGGDPNAQPGCGYNCGKTCTTYKAIHPICPRIPCKPNGCDCKDGYVFDTNVNKCVLPKDCTPTCKVNEEYSPCINGGCGPKNCSQVGQPNICVDPVTCAKGCVCVKGYLRASNGTCVPTDQCPPAPQCPDNEVYDPCPPINCPPKKACLQVCTPTCTCADGLIRCKNGRCAKPENCQTTPPQCPDKEVYDPCPPINCPPGKSCTQVCTPTCKCADGLIRCKDGRCAKPENCQTKPPVTTPAPPTKPTDKPKPPVTTHAPPTKPTDKPKPPVTTPAPPTKPTDKPSYPPICKKNEVYYNCSGGCTPRRCSEIGFPLNCDEKCTPGCVCKDNYVRADNGTCIPITDCPSCGGDRNAQQGCSNYCGHTCSDYNKPPTGCPLYCMSNGCDCRKGFVYDNNSKSCVKPEDCTAPQCPDNEVYDPCPPINCPPGKSCAQVCTPTCRCADGLIRCKDGRCAKPKNCQTTPPQCPDNEVYDPCPPINCPPGKSCAQVCTPTCRCADGLIRCKDGQCAKPENCQTKPPVTTPAPPTKPTDKPIHPPRCGKNEVYNNCSDAGCRPYHCSELGFPLNCDKKCKPGCICKDDYVRDDNGICIPIKSCPSCGGDKNAESGCGNNCGKTCGAYKLKPAICTLACRLNGCDCRDGFVYDSNVKSCVRPKDCTPRCKVNEEYSSCINGGCGPKNCSQVGQPDICVDPVTCIKGCVCVKGYLRASNGTCVPTNQCPPPDCPSGEVWDPCPTVKCDGDNCPKTRDSPQTCPVGIVCDKPRCVCGYNRKRDRKTGKCIPITDCPPFKCDCNEEYQACPLSCPGEKCSDLFNKRTCPRIGIIVNCRPACKCIKGYSRNNDGKCIPSSECPTPAPDIK